jgi:MFS family permease
MIRSVLPEPAAPPARRLPRTVIALGVVSLCTDLSSEMIVPLLPAFLGTLGAGPTFLGVLEGVATATASFLRLVSGALADRARRRKPLILLGYGLSSLVRPLIALAQAPLHVLGVRFLDRAGKGLRGSPRDALVADVTPAALRGRAYGVHAAFDHLGALLGPLVAWLLLAQAGWSLRAVFWASAIPAALAIIVLIAFVREQARAQAGAVPRLSILPPAVPALRRYLAVIALFSFAGSADLFVVQRAAELGVPLAQLPLLWAMLHAVKSALSSPLGAASDRFGRRPLIAAGFALHAVVFAGFSAAAVAWHAWALFCVYGVCAALIEGAERAYVADLAPQDQRGRAFGAFHFVSGITALPGAIVFGALWEGVGAGVAFGAGAALAALAAASVALWVRERASQPEERP